MLSWSPFSCFSKLPALNGPWVGLSPWSIFLRVDHHLVWIPQGQWIGLGLLWPVGWSDVEPTTAGVSAGTGTRPLTVWEEEKGETRVNEERVGEPGASPSCWASCLQGTQEFCNTFEPGLLYVSKCSCQGMWIEHILC